MRPVWWTDAEHEADLLVKDFTARLKQKLAASPEHIITRKNPFLFRVRATSDAHALAKMVIDAYLSSSEETMFGGVLEGIAVVICKHSKGGWKSAVGKMDLEYNTAHTRTIIQIKSGTNWGNSSQHQAQKAAFNTASRILRQGDSDLNVRCVEGCCYGKSEVKDKGAHIRIVGYDFWQEISDWDGTAEAVMELLGKHASNGLGDVRREAYKRMVTFLRDAGVVDELDNVCWPKLLALVMRPPNP